MKDFALSLSQVTQKEYEMRAIMPGPFSVLENIYYLSELALQTNIFRKLKKHLNRKTEYDVTPLAATLNAYDSLEQYQERHTDSFLELRNAERQATLDKKVTRHAL